jgi:hypothetical protein
MNKQETTQILALLNAAYPAFYSKMSRMEIDGVIALWAEMFVDDDFGLVKYALKELIATHTGYPPDIAALKTKIAEVTQAATDKPTHEELWQKLKAAASNGYYNARAEFEKLPPVLKRYVGSPATLREYAMIDADTFNTVNHGQFLKQIKVIEDREEYALKMPDNVKMLIASVYQPLEAPKQLDDGEVNDKRNKLLDSLDRMKEW